MKNKNEIDQPIIFAELIDKVLWNSGKNNKRKNAIKSKISVIMFNIFFTFVL